MGREEKAEMINIMVYIEKIYGEKNLEEDSSYGLYFLVIILRV